MPHTRSDPSRERTIILNQLLLGLVILLAAAFVLMSGQYQDLASLILGVSGVFIATVCAIIVRWDRLPSLATIAVPALDIVSIGSLSLAYPSSGLALLWVFPVLWVSLTFGAMISSITVALTTVLYLAPLIETPSAFEVRLVLMPLTLASLAVFGQVMSRRATAQRSLLARQSRTLQRAFERARDQESLVSEVLQAVDFGVTRIGADGRVTVTNEAHARLHGDPDAPLFQEDGVTPVPAADRPLARAARGETFEGVELWHGGIGTERRALHVTARRIADDGAAGVVVVSRDVTAERNALRARDDLIASVSHELRTPLTSIMGYLDLALDDPGLPASARGALEVAERNAQRLFALVTDILSASRAPDADPAETLRASMIDLSAIARQAVEAALPRAAERGVVIDTEGIESTAAFADAGRVRQVVDNLLSNAIKYGRDEGRVWIGCTEDGDRAILAVRDDGPGIAEAEQPRVFERFFRADAVRRSSVHGSGLGLAISRDITRDHGGDLTLQSIPGVGSTFVVTLPARRPLPHPAPQESR
ncbi:sensor histidine kinase [Microbacterium marinilacus]|uniref:Sensor-like histidine kinase SenX3 n=1 Tax=Microbacterium marinilacus TaxID=415209 RepID=A0ABP7BMW1_9MICO|nr:PAS domain-containing sensor histidine kinase [Microbacterium marinilacus]MBY0689698.1 PAS domain-containing sensor histidine kinase [Microbacterium marinilacus]